MIEVRLTQTQIEIPRWTAPEFERMVFDSKPKVAVFDCDGTLWGGGRRLRLHGLVSGEGPGFALHK